MNMDFDGFPNIDNIDVQKTQTNFDYNLWGANTQLFLSHIDAKFTSSYEHVLKFNTKAEKDAYFKTNAPIKLNTSFLIKPDGTIRLQIPYVNLINYNYLVAVYPDIPALDYNPANARNEYYYFIEDCKMISPNTTELKLTLDVWNTYIDDITIEYMMLERGHYPMTLTTVEEYLANPLLHRIGLGTADVNYGSLCKINKYNKYDLLEGSTTYVIVATNADISTFVDKTTTYNGGTLMEKGIYYFAVKQDQWSTFLTNVMRDMPAFMQTIVGIMIATDKFIKIGGENVTFNDVTCYTNIGGVLNAIDYNFTKADFGYDPKYENLVKLYTYPYAAVEYIDQYGKANIIKIEDLYVGKFALNIFTKLCVANPTSRAIILNVGGEGMEGDFNLYYIDIPIPTTVANQNPNNAYMLETKYQRIQQQNDINLASAIAKRANDQNKTFTEEQVEVDKRIEFTNLQEMWFRWHVNNNMLAKDANLNRILASINLDDAFSNSSLISAISAGANAAMSALGSATPITPALANIAINTGGPVLSFNNQQQIWAAMWKDQGPIPGLASINNGVPNWGNDAESVKLYEAYKNKLGNIDFENDSGINIEKLKISLDAADQIFRENWTEIWERSQSSGVGPVTFVNYVDYHEPGDHSRVGLKTNLQLSQNQANYERVEQDRIETKVNAEAAIQNAINQSYYGPNRMYGKPGDVSIYDRNRNIIQYHIKTQDPHAIKLAGDQFLRYGYRYEGEVDFTTFLIMPEFTYWKVSDVWMNSDKVNSKVINSLTDILKKGVTVWGKGYYNPVPEPEKSSYGTLTYIKNGETISYEITEEDDFLSLCLPYSSPNNIITFSFDIIHADNVIGWKFNTSPNTLVPDIIPDNFLSYFHNLNSDIQFPDNVTEIGNYFLAGEGIFNSNIIFNDNLTKIGNYFLAYQTKFNKPISIPNITTIGEEFLYACKSFNQPISLPNVISIGDDFLCGCESFNQPISFPKITTINNGFLMFCKNFNQTIDLPNVTTIGDYFLASTPSFNQPISLPKVTTIGNSFKNSFADDYYNFNQTIDLPNVTTIGDSFLYECKYFNQPISLPNVTTIGDYFLAHCYSFNQPISLPKVISIGDRFMYEWSSFNQDFTFSNTLQHVGDYCFHITLNSTIMPDYTLTFTINCNPDVFVNNTKHPHGRSESFYWYNFDLGGPLGPNPNLPSITVNGIYADEFKTRFPNFMYGSYPDYYGRNFI